MGDSLPFPPPVGSGDTRQLYRLPGLKFQALCRDLLDSGADPEISACREYGTPGERQHGIDLIADRKGGGVDVAQCKCMRDFPPAEIRDASLEFLKYLDLWRSRDVRRFILLVASEVNQTQRQQEILKQAREFKEQYGILYELWPATKIVNRLRQHRGIVGHHLHPAWAETLCGPNSESSVRIELARHIALTDRLVLALSEATDERLSTMREKWRQGHRHQALQILAQTKSNPVTWNTLPPKVQAGFLRFECSIALEAEGDPVRAEVLLNEANGLSPAPDDVRLRAAILWHRGDTDGALTVLAVADTDALRHFKAFLLITLRKVDDAELLLNQISKETAETLQLRGLCSLANHRLGEARLSLQKALEVSPGWVSLQYTAAVIDYFSALASAVVPPFVPPWPEPVPSIYALQDDEARGRLRRAAQSFQRIAAAAEFSEGQRCCLETWRIACLAIDLDQQDSFEEEVARILRSNPTHHRVLAWATVARLKTLIEVPAQAIRQLAIDGKAELEQILVLAQYYVACNKPKKAATLLDRHRGFFAAEGVLPLWATWAAQVEARLGRTKRALRLIEDAALSERESRLLRSRVLLLDSSGDLGQTRQYLEDSYQATGDPRFLLDWVEINARTKAWAAAADRSRELLKQLPTPEVLRLVAFCAHEAKRFSLCLELLNDGQHLHARSRMPGDLRRMRVHCQIELGLLPAAVDEAERLAREEPSLQNLVGLAQAYLSTGDFRRLCVTAHDILLLDQVPPDALLRLAGQTRWEDRRLSASLWRRAAKIGIADENVVPALQLGFELGLDSELADLTRRMEDLGRSDRGGVRMASLDDLRAHAQAFHRQAQQLNVAYQETQLPIHFIAPGLNLTLAEVYHDCLDDNAAAQFLWHQACVFTRSGRRVLPALAEAQIGKFRLNADITAILLAHHFGFLEFVERAFAPIRIPRELIHNLAVMRDRLTSGQAQKILSYRKIVSDQQLGRITIAPDHAASRTDMPELLRDAWAPLAELALEEAGFLVDFLPLLTPVRPVQLGELPTDIRDRVIGLRAVLNALEESGALTSDRHTLILDQTLTRVEPVTPSPSSGAKLYFSGTVIETFADLDLLDALTDHFQVFIERREIQRLQAEIRSSERRARVARWVADLIAHLNDAIQAGRYETISSEKLVTFDEPGPNLLEEADDKLSVACLLSLIRLQGDSADRVWVDDRFVSSYPVAGQTPIVDSIEVLQQLVALEHFSRERYYETLSRMRAEGVCFLPASKDEILCHIAPANVNESGVVETTALRNLRRGLAASFLAARFLRQARTDGQRFDPGEYEVLVRSVSAVSEALSALWIDPAVSGDKRIAKADWILSRLFVPHHALRKIAGVQVDGDDGYAFAMLAASLLTRTIGFPASEAGGEAAREYNAWLYRRFLERRFALEPVLLTQTTTYLQQIIEQIWPKDLVKHEARVAAALIQKYFLCLPEPIRCSIAPNSDFLAKIGVRTEGRVKVADLQFDRIQYLTAAREAINGREGVANLLGSDRIIRFLPTTPLGEGIQLEHPDLNGRITAADWLHRLLVESPARRETIFLEIQGMLDIPAKGLRDAASDLASTEDFVRLIEKGEALRQRSLPYFYEQLEETLQRGSSIKIRDLLPGDLGALLQYLRLEEPAASSSFIDALRFAVNDMLEGLPLAEVLDRLFRLPIDLPGDVVARVQALPTEERRDLARSLLELQSSPLSRINLAKLLWSCFSREEAFVGVWNMFPSPHDPELRAYVTMIKWTFDQLLMKRSNSRWSAPAILATSWAHGDRLFCILQSCGWEASTIVDNFSLTPARIHTLFRDSDALDRDVANPHNVSFEALLVCGLRPTRGGATRFRMEPEAKARLRSLMLLSTGGLPLPKPDLLPDTTTAPNQLSSFSWL